MKPEDFRNPEFAKAYLEKGCHTLAEVCDEMIAKLRVILPYNFGIDFPGYFRSEFYRCEQLGWSYVPITISFDGQKKRIKFPNHWTLKSFSSEDFSEKHNGIFIKTGGDSNLLVLDFDMAAEDFRILDAELIHGALDHKPRAYTPRGCHIYLTNKHAAFWKQRYNLQSLTTVNKALGVDVRENNAGVIAPKTRIENYGEYFWEIQPTIYLLDYDPQDLIPLMDAIYRFQEVNHIVLPARDASIFPDSGNDDWLKAQNIVAVLSQIRIDYRDWIKVGMALYARFGEQGKYLWDYFLSNPNYNDTERTIDAHWRSFRSVNRVSLASLFFVAQKYGITL
jgi:hypothetical protein